MKEKLNTKPKLQRRNMTQSSRSHFVSTRKACETENLFKTFSSGIRKYFYIFLIFVVMIIGVFEYTESEFEHSTRFNVYEKKIQQLQQQVIEAEKAKVAEQQQVAKLKKIVALQDQKRTQINSIIKDLDRCKHPKIALGIGFSESHLRYDVKHPTTDTHGIGGIKDGYWSKQLRAHNIPLNSLQAIDYVFNASLKLKGNNYEALKFYKGSKDNDYSYRLTKTYIEKVEHSPNFKKLIAINQLQTNLKREVGI
jgi:hypothetical protein